MDIDNDTMNIEAQFGGPDRVWGNFAEEITADDTETPGQGESQNPAPEAKPEEKPDEVETPKSEDIPEKEETPLKSGSIFEDEDGETDTEQPQGPDEVEKPAKMSKIASETWDKLKTSHATKVKGLTDTITAKDREIGALQAQVKEIETMRGKATVADELQAKYDELSKEVALLDIKKSPEYREAIEKPLIAIEKAAIALVKSQPDATEADVSRLLDAIGEADPVKQRSMFRELTAGWENVDIIDARQMLTDAATIFAKQDEMEKNSHAAYQEREKISAEKQADSNRKSKEEIEGFVDQAAENFLKKIPFVALREGETKENRQAALAERAKKVDWNSMTPADKAAAATAVIGMKAAVATIQSLMSQVKTLEARVEDQNSSTPVIRESGGGSSAVEEEDFLAKTGFGGDNNIIQRLSVTL